MTPNSQQPGPAASAKPIFAFWIEQPPGVPFRGEGLMVVVANLVRSMARRGDTRVILGCAIWTRDDLVAFLHQYGVSDSDYEVVTGSSRIPVVVRLVEFKKRLRSKRKKARPPLLRRFSDFVTRTLRSPTVAGAFVSSRILLFLLALPVLIGFAIVGGMLLVARAVMGLFKSLKPKSDREHPRPDRWVPKADKKQPPDPSFTATTKRRFKAARVKLKQNVRAVKTQVRVWYEQLLRVEFLRVAKRGARLGVDVWYITTPGAKVGMTDLQTRTMLAVADFVPFDFEYGFEKNFPVGWARDVLGFLQQGAARASATISYSASVRDRHAIERLGVPRDRAYVVPHAPPFLPAELVADERRARALIREYLSSELATEHSWTASVAPGYVDQLDLGKLDYVFVSSQIRPHKNTLNMVLAMERLIRRKYVSCKCVLSGEIGWGSGLADQVLIRELQYDVLSLPRIPTRHHAAFFRCARLAVVPTLFEGAFPFPFSESMSVGTPVIMSRIPMVEEIIPEDLGRLMLFDPFRVEDIADKIEWGLNNRDELYALQKPIFDKLAKRTWDHVASEYINVAYNVRTEGTVG